ncbi:hypothetical protein GLOIN_2v1773984 [Rhizophagus irregularis DAOM 181602=DAOM 197198]|nr:hypothetical protein GLOIN_2v1773984 [Rhizophagus irregularis DAOM 181602=DAOM 197198]
MDHHLNKVSEINNGNTNYIISNFKESISLNNTSSVQPYESHYSPFIRGRRNRRELLRKEDALYSFIRRLPAQVTNDPFVNDIFNGSSF